jgi:hypothetical protein
VRTTTTTATTFVLRKEGVLGFWYIMDLHHLNRSLPFGFTSVRTHKYKQHQHFSIWTTKTTLNPEKFVEQVTLFSRLLYDGKNQHFSHVTVI